MFACQSPESGSFHPSPAEFMRSCTGTKRCTQMPGVSNRPWPLVQYVPVCVTVVIGAAGAHSQPIGGDGPACRSQLDPLRYPAALIGPTQRGHGWTALSGTGFGGPDLEKFHLPAPSTCDPPTTPCCCCCCCRCRARLLPLLESPPRPRPPPSRPSTIASLSSQRRTAPVPGSQHRIFSRARPSRV